MESVAIRSLHNPNLFKSDVYRHAAIAVAVGIAIRILVAIPVSISVAPVPLVPMEWLGSRCESILMVPLIILQFGHGHLR